MITEQQISKFLDSFLVTKLTSGIKRRLYKMAGHKSIPRAAEANRIAFPVIVTDDISKEVAMELSKTAEVKLAYDVKNILERRIDETPQDLASVIDLLPFESDHGAVDLQKLNLIDEQDIEGAVRDHIAEGVYEVKSVALDVVKNQTMNDNEELFSEAKSAVIVERGATPTYIEVAVKYKKSDQEVKEVKYQLGIQAIPRYVESNELRLKLSTYDTKRFYKKFVNLSNKEQSFIKDFLLDWELVKGQAKDAVQGYDVFKSIERKNLLKDIGVNVYPFTVLLVSQNFVEKLKESEMIDLYEEASMLMNKLLAMAIVVYDHDTDLVNIRFDGEPKVTTYPYDEVVKDTSRYERELRQLIRLNK